ncbi:hypothetical protein OFM39_30790, partial [Escherichia coli]|nr:hypothetical protein [Escherichia coli]
MHDLKRIHRPYYYLPLVSSTDQKLTASAQFHTVEASIGFRRSKVFTVNRIQMQTEIIVRIKHNPTMLRSGKLRQCTAVGLT